MAIVTMLLSELITDALVCCLASDFWAKWGNQNFCPRLPTGRKMRRHFGDLPPTDPRLLESYKANGWSCAWPGITSLSGQTSRLALARQAPPRRERPPARHPPRRARPSPRSAGPPTYVIGVGEGGLGRSLYSMSSNPLGVTWLSGCTELKSGHWGIT